MQKLNSRLTLLFLLQLNALKKEWRPVTYNGSNTNLDSSFGLSGGSTTGPGKSPVGSTNMAAMTQSERETLELRKIKKVQSFFRGWLCRRRWKQIVEQYIKSPHAESMRKRNR